MAAAREELGPERTLMIDGGMAYSVKRAIQLVRELEPLGIYWLEEPLLADDYDGYRRLSDAVPVRIAAGEADSGLRAYRALVELGHVDVLQPDLARCGGFTVARQIAEMAAATRIEVVPHCFSTGILVAASLHFTAAIAGATLLGVLGGRLAARERPPDGAVRARRPGAGGRPGRPRPRHPAERRAGRAAALSIDPLVSGAEVEPDSRVTQHHRARDVPGSELHLEKLTGDAAARFEGLP